MKAIKYLITIAFFVIFFLSAQAQNLKEIDRLLSGYNYKAAAAKLAEYERETWQNNDCDVLLQVYKYQRVIAYVNDTLGRYLVNLERKAHKFTPPCKNLFFLSLARAYRDYYNDNDYRILTRAKLSKRPADISRWSAEDFAGTIDRLYDLALSGESLLKKTQYDYCPSVIEPGELPA